jgi:hypothetical protein
MTMKITDIAPGEAQLVELSEHLAKASQSSSTLDLVIDASFLEAARTMLLKLDQRPQEAFHGGVGWSTQQVESYLDLDPDFVESAKDLLRAFIERTESHHETS